jgi:hypothetical protein
MADLDADIARRAGHDKEPVLARDVVASVRRGRAHRL